MPELAEVEAYRRLAERVVGRQIAEVVAPDAWYLKGGLTAPALEAALAGRTITATRRIGKLLLLETAGTPFGHGAGTPFGHGAVTPSGAGAATPFGHGAVTPSGHGAVTPSGHGAGDEGPVLGLRFGMSGRLLVDGTAALDDLMYASNRELEKWDRFALRFAPPAGGDLRIRDPRRLGGVLLDPEEARLGPDALTVTPAALARSLDSAAPLKARLMDQARLAGVGNLAADEALWRAGLDPARPARSLTPAERRRLHRHLRATMADFLSRGGSHTGDLMPERRPGGICPRDGTPLVRRTVGGRTTWSCPHHQV